MGSKAALFFDLNGAVGNRVSASGFLQLSRRAFVPEDSDFRV